MANATDIITYIGIPLAVLGVMPLLWNMVKSFIIRYRLLSSLPKRKRKGYSLIIDPAAGSVSVGVDTPKLHFEILWRSPTPAFPNTRRVSECQNDLLGESWMGLNGIYPWYYGSRKRFVVESDLRVQSVGLECDWNAFVRLCLALGVDPYAGGLLDLKRNMSTSFKDFVLKSLDGFSVMNVQKRENRVISSVNTRGAGGAALSIKTGLAWECGMIVVQDRDVHVMIDRHISREGTMPLNFAWATYHLHFGKQIWPGQAMEKAITWVLYAESLYHESSRNPPQPLIPKKDLSLRDSLDVNVLPVTQQMLKVREDALEQLRLMAHLEDSLMEIFSTKRPIVESILATLQQEWSTPDVVFETKRSARPYTENPPGYLDIWNELQGNETFVALEANFNPVPTLRTRSDADLTQLTTPMAVLSRVIIAVSSIQKWERKEWSVDIDENGKRSFTTPEDPMVELLSDFEGYDPANPYGSDEPFVYLV